MEANLSERAPASKSASLPVAPRALSRIALLNQSWLRKSVIVLALLAIWEVSVRALNINPLLFPPASDVLRVLVQTTLSGELPGFAWQSVQTLLTGMVIGVALAVVLVTAATFFALGRDLLETLTAMFNPVPAIALLPLALLWFGLSVNSLIFVIVHSVLWPMALNLYTGFITVPTTLVRVGQNFGLRGVRLVIGILLPAAFPNILTGLKIAWAFAWRTIIASELVFGVQGNRGGLGWFIYTNRYNLNTAHVFAGILTVIIIGLLVENVLFRYVEKVTVKRWGMQTQ
ncbi:MAG: ABC transporter permease [Chloroflexi bacterium]|nr:ABC transporter permease [Chloroflexota bacterium]